MVIFLIFLPFNAPQRNIMKQSLKFSTIFAFGLFIGFTLFWIKSHTTVNINDKNIMLTQIIKSSGTTITPENFSCEGDTESTVGAVAASILEYNLIYDRNRVSLGCFEKICNLSVSYCPPWKTVECGSRLLKFEIDENNRIQEESFTCIDMP